MMTKTLSFFCTVRMPGSKNKNIGLHVCELVKSIEALIQMDVQMEA